MADSAPISVMSLFVLYGVDQVATGTWQSAIRLAVALFVVDENTDLALGAVSKPLAAGQNAVLVVLCFLGGGTAIIPRRRRSVVFLLLFAVAGLGFDTAWVKVAISEELPSKRVFDRLTQHASAMEKLGSLVGWPLAVLAYGAGGPLSDALLSGFSCKYHADALAFEVPLLSTSTSTPRAFVSRRDYSSSRTQDDSAAGVARCFRVSSCRQDRRSKRGRDAVRRRRRQTSRRGLRSTRDKKAVVVVGTGTFDVDHRHSERLVVNRYLEAPSGDGNDAVPNDARPLVTSLILGFFVGLVESTPTLYALCTFWKSWTCHAPWSS